MDYIKHKENSLTRGSSVPGSVTRVTYPITVKNHLKFMYFLNKKNLRLFNVNRFFKIT